MYKKTCKVIVLRNKPIAFLTSWLPSPSALLLSSVVRLRESTHKKGAILQASIWPCVPAVLHFKMEMAIGLKLQ